MEDSLMLQRRELTDLTLQVANIIYDLYYTQCYVQINKNRREDEIREKALTQEVVDDVFLKTSELLKEFSFKSENEEIMDLYKKILKENKGLLLTEKNISDIAMLAIADSDHPMDIGPCIIHFNSFQDEETEEVKDSMDYIMNMIDKFYMEHDLKSFIEFCAEIMPLIVKYVINELEICDLLKSLGTVNGSRVYYINVESKPCAPLGFSNEFSYPIIPYRMVGFINDDGEITNSNRNSSIHLSVIIDEINIYQFDNTEEYINIIIELRENNYLRTYDEKYILYKKYIQLSFKDYLKLYMTNDVSKFMANMLSLMGG